MHEAFHKDDPKRYTRPWLAWANTLFGEFVIQTAKRFRKFWPENIPKALPVK